MVRTQADSLGPEGSGVPGMGNKYKYVDNPMDGPVDGVSLEADGVHTRFKVKKGARCIDRQSKTHVRIMGSVNLGVVSVTDQDRNQMITVTFEDMLGTLAEALRVSHEKEGEKCQSENHGVDGAALLSSGLEPGA